MSAAASAAAAAASAAASSTTASIPRLFTLGDISYWLDEVILLLLLLQPARHSRHTDVCLGTSS